MTNKNPLHKFDPHNWQPKSEEGKEALRQYLEWEAKQKASKIKATSDEEKLAIARQLLAEVEANRRKQAQLATSLTSRETEQPTSGEGLFESPNDNADAGSKLHSENSLFKGGW